MTAQQNTNAVVDTYNETLVEIYKHILDDRAPARRFLDNTNDLAAERDLICTTPASTDTETSRDILAKFSFGPAVATLQVTVHFADDFIRRDVLDDTGNILSAFRATPSVSFSFGDLPRVELGPASATAVAKFMSDVASLADELALGLMKPFWHVIKKAEDIKNAKAKKAAEAAQKLVDIAKPIVEIVGKKMSTKSPPELAIDDGIRKLPPGEPVVVEIGKKKFTLTAQGENVGHVARVA